MMKRGAVVGALLVTAVPAWAGDQPIYAAVPDWVIPAPPIDMAKLDAASPIVQVLDNQQRLVDGRVSAYVERDTYATTAEVMAQMGTVSLTWLPDKGDLTVHRVDILRGAERIDVLKGGARFTVLRREQNLEQNTLDGSLTATLAVEGLRVGDVLSVAYTTSQSDAALKGRIQTVAPALADPFRATFARSRLSWPAKDKVAIRSYAENVSLVPKDVGGMRTVELTMPLPKPTELPNDVPARFQRPPFIEATTFADWADVSRTMAPLFAADGLIAPGSPLAGEVARIMAADATPMGRTARALELVQGQIRYLALGMNGGNYVPQTPARTWELRYGDCKAKTLILLAMLRAMGVEAEPVLANTQGGDLVPRRLAMPGAFDHIIVRATVDGRSLWLDGTDTGARLPDIGDTPAFRNVLPLRIAGADLMTLPLHADARPTASIDLTLDQRAGLDTPTLFDATMTMRGSGAAMLNVAAAQGTAEQKRELAQRAVIEMLGEPQISATTIRYDASSGIATLTVSGLVTTHWRREERQRRMMFPGSVSQLNFNPDRARAAWQALPVATQGPGTTALRVKVLLPEAGKGFTIENDQAITTSVAGALLTRKVAMVGGEATLDERIEMLGAEIAPAALPAERARVAAVEAHVPRLVAPANIAPRWQEATASRAAGRYRGIEERMAAAIAADPKEITGYTTRASFRAGVYDRAGAIADLDRVIALAPSAAAYLDRSHIQSAMGNVAKARADADEAAKLDPGSIGPLLRVSETRADAGDVTGALAMIAERAAQGGKDRVALTATKTDLMARGGDVAGAIALLDTTLTERPGDPTLLNQRCWIKGTYKVALDTALKDCTKAIELSDDSAHILDSRAMVYFKMGRFDDAKADIASALEGSPDMSGSLFLRGVIARQEGRAADAARDLAGARLISPQIDTEYARFGIKA